MDAHALWHRIQHGHGSPLLKVFLPPYEILMNENKTLVFCLVNPSYVVKFFIEQKSKRRRAEMVCTHHIVLLF